MGNLRILLMNKEVFWKVRAELSRGLFYVKRIIHSINSHIGKQRTNISIQKSLVFQTVKKLFLAACLLFIVCALDYWIFDVLGLFNPLSKLNQQTLSDILIAALSISGIFLGLYFSNIATVYSSRYANAPASVRHLFENEVVTSNSINDIILFIIISIVALLLSIFGLTLKPVTICFLFFLSIKNIVSFAIIGKRSFQFSDVFEITTPIYKSIRELYKSACYRGHFFKDINYQSYYQTSSSRNIQNLSTIASYSIEGGTAKSISMLTFMCKNLELIRGYWESKASIPFDSKWFPIKEVYKKWYEAGESEINIALSTGTSIRNKTETDIFWFEEQIYAVNDMCFEHLATQKNLMAIFEYIKYLAKVVASAIEAGCSSYLLNKLNQIYERVVKISRESSAEDREYILQILEGILFSYSSFIVESNKYIQGVRVNQIVSMFSTEKNGQLGIASLNCKEITTLLECVIAEKKIEKIEVTPRWYISQIVARRILDSIFNLFDDLVNIYNKQLKVAIEEQISNKNYTEALLMLTSMAEAKSKLFYCIHNAQPVVKAAEVFRVDNTMPWPTATLASYVEELHSIDKELPQLWVTASVAFTAMNYTKLEKYPDLLGQCYNVLCNFLVNSIANDDIDCFRNAYTKFWPVIRLYQDITRQDLIKKKDSIGTDLLFYLYSFPMVEFCMISGYAILWGSLLNTPEWISLVNEVRDQIDSQKENELNPLENLVGVLSVSSKQFPAIYPRDLIQTGWTMIITNILREREDIEFKRSGPFGDDRFETDDPFVNEYLAHGFDMIGLNPIYELYLVKCINPCVNAEKRYKSRSHWERSII